MKRKNAERAEQPLSPDLLRKMHAYWRAANYLPVGQIYLYDNPLLGILRIRRYKDDESN